MSGPQKFVLENGVRILVEPVTHVQSAAIGLWCRTGSSHEFENEAGITHLIEHMLFKGTETRTAKQIAEEIEGRGGMLNAFTDKESTCYYCRTLSDEAKTGIDVLCDMMRHSLIDPEELGREKGVVLEEIKRGEDEPGDHVHEVHLSNRWGEHPLGKPIIGTRESVSSFEDSNLRSYMERRYRGENILLSIAGNVNPDEIRQFAEERLGSIQGGNGAMQIPKPGGKASDNYIAKEIEQVHFCIGTDGCSVYDDELYTLAVLDAALGGSMSSRLFQEIREKRGLVYAIGSYTQSYSAGGAYTVYGGTSPDTWPLVQELVRQEFDKLCENGLESDELERTQSNITGSLVLGLEGMSSRMMRNARNEFVHSRHIPVEETMGKIRAVNLEGVRSLAQRLLGKDLVSTTAIGPS